MQRPLPRDWKVPFTRRLKVRVTVRKTPPCAYPSLAYRSATQLLNLRIPDLHVSTAAAEFLEADVAFAWAVFQRGSR